MANSVIPILLAIICTAMIISIFKARKTNESLMENLEQANTAKKTLHDEIDKLAAELVALKGPSENTSEEIEMNQSVTV